MKWKKLGNIYCASGEAPWMMTHAMMPCVYRISESIFRVYFSSRDSQNRSRPVSLDLHFSGGRFEIGNLSTSPLLDLGPRGAYDDCGVMPTCVVDIQARKHMFFNGWCLGKSVPFFSFNGFAVENDDGTFRKLVEYPNALNRSAADPYSTLAPFVMNDEGRWRMWYVSLRRWDEVNHFYHIRYAESADGLNWSPRNLVCIDFSAPSEYAIARPWVVRDRDRYRMWFSSRALNGIPYYRLRYAESADGIHWTRKDSSVGIDVSESGWDSEMICYGAVFDCNGKRYMLYNGNGYGRTGFGLAVLEDE